MSGHSKWANIKHKKDKTDKKRGSVFTKLVKELMIAAKEGGGNPEANRKLKEVIIKARSANMPNDTILRSIKKASGDMDLQNFEEVVYEGYGPGGVAIIVEVMTDNRNRTAGDLRHYFDKFGGNLGSPGCVSYLFDKKGVLIIEKKSETDEENLMLASIELGAEDFNIEDEYYEILTESEVFIEVKEGIEKLGYEFESASIEMISLTTTKLEDPKQIEMFEKLIERLEDHDDTKNVFHNME